MLTTWLTLALVLLGQEAVTTSAALFEADKLGLNLWGVHALWLVLEIFDLMLGYAIGKLVQRRYAKSRFVRRAERVARSLEKRMGRYGRNLILIVMGFFLFPYLSSFFVSWLADPFLSLAPLLFIGDAFYYATEWGIALGALQTSAGLYAALAALFGLALLFAFITKLVSDRMLAGDEPDAL